jgi:hypothetical protein
MKKLICVLLLFTACKGNIDKKVVVDQKMPAKSTSVADTVFLEKEHKKNYYHAVFIEKNRASKSYKGLLNFAFDHNDSVAFNEYLKILKVRDHKPLKKYSVAALPKEWLPLYLYKGKYYLYEPSNSGNTGRRILTDSTLTYWNTDGPEPKPLLDFKKAGQHRYSLRSLPYYQFVKKSVINIYVIDPAKKLAVWEDTSLPADYRYGLYVPKEYAKQYDLVSTYCSTGKTTEFKFDKIDFKSLIKGL